MKVLIFGNLASGKTTLALKLTRKLSQFQYLAIDNFRRDYGDGSMEKEKQAKEMFFQSIKENKNQIIEAMGFGDGGAFLAETLGPLSEPKLIVLLKTPLNVCLKRLEQRKWDVPYPAPKEKAFSLARITHELISDDILAFLWESALNTQRIDFENTDNNSIKKIINRINHLS